ncbi:ciliary microtubule-associated protein 3 isoform X1 [Struthio camelus]|uniref:ciliary microtubule-associated protein 3 isoform X1 n=1 Tax=Struthio camelus TaxID=8801 RepID=UPI003603E09B
MIGEWELTGVQKQISFGSCQERKLFPLHHAPDRLGIQLVPIRGDPWLGPGRYQNHKKSSLVYSLAHKPQSKKGYVIGARTAQRFIPEPQTVTPGPGMYQSWWKKERKCQPAYAPFSIKSPRFPDKPLEREFFPGPGSYEADKLLHKKITWPMKFGSPDWSLVPMPVKRTLRGEVPNAWAGMRGWDSLQNTADTGNGMTA